MKIMNETNIFLYTFSNNYSFLGNWAFQSMTLLTQLVLTNGLTILGSYMFRFSAIFSVTIPSTITSIGNNFY